MKKQFAIIGLGQFGMALAEELSALGHEVLGVDADAGRVDEAAGVLTHCICADCTDDANLQALGLSNFDVAVVAVGEIQASVMITLFLKEMEAPLVVAKAGSDIHRKLLQKVGADRVVFPEKDMGMRMAHNLASGGVLEAVELSRHCRIIECAALRDKAIHTAPCPPAGPPPGICGKTSRIRLWMACP